MLPSNYYNKNQKSNLKMEVKCELVHERSREKFIPLSKMYILLDNQRRFVVKLYGVPKINSNIWIKFSLLILLIIIEGLVMQVVSLLSFQRSNGLATPVSLRKTSYIPQIFCLLTWMEMKIMCKSCDLLSTWHHMKRPNNQFSIP